MRYHTDIDPVLVAALAAKSGQGGGVTPEQIQAAVDAYLEENPVSAGELSVSNHIVSIIGGGGSESP